MIRIYSNKLKFEAYDFWGGNMRGAQQKYTTWKVSQSAYIKQIGIVEDRIWWSDFNSKSAQLLSFKTKSKPYNDLLSELNAAIATKDKTKADDVFKRLGAKKKAIENAAAKRKGTSSGFVYDPNNYTAERKNNAVWDKNISESRNRYEKDSNALFSSLSPEEQKAWLDYTGGSGHMNRPFGGYEKSWTNYKGIGNAPLNMEGGENNIRNLYNVIERNVLKDDIWLQRGVDSNGFKGLFGKFPMENLDDLFGKEVVNYSFVSCGTAKGTGFGGYILNIYCPKGTKGIYVDPKSRFRRENETILQLCTKFRVTKIEKTARNVYVDLDVIGYEKPPLL